MTKLEEALLNLAGDILDKNFIITPETRLEVVRMMIAGGNLVEVLNHHEGLLKYVSDGTALSNRDPFEVRRPSVKLPMSLAPAERTALIASCPDVDIQFMDGGYAPHGRAAALRMIHWHQAMALVSHHLGTVLDIGGNYAKYAKSADRRSYVVHSCTKRIVEPEPVGELEWHRHVQRDVDLEISGITETNYCINGAENCDVQAKHAVCIHAIYDIPPDAWTHIFDKHGLELVVCFFHYDVNIEVYDAGYMAGPGMHWSREGPNGIQFHFESDSSHPYIHRRDWMIKYGSTWTMTRDDWEYVLYYEVEYICDGNAKSTITRLDKSTLGHTENIAQFRYSDVDESVIIKVPKFNPSLGRSVSNPLAYELIDKRVSMALFSHVMRFGVSNDTERPDLPLTADQVRDQCHTFNHVRKINGTSITVPYRLGSDDINDIATGMYLLIVKRAAMNHVKYVAYTENMKSLQRRWGDESVIKMTGKAFCYAAIAPFILLAESIEDVVSLMVAGMRRDVANDLVLMHESDVSPYRIMRPIHASAGSLETEVKGTSFVPPSDHEYFNRAVQPDQFYRIFKDTMDPDVRRKVEDYLEEHGLSTMQYDKREDVPGQADHIDQDEEIIDREAWVRQCEAVEDSLEKRQLPPRDPRKHSFAERTNPDKVWEFAREALTEYQLYNIDVALHTLQFHSDICRQTWGAGRVRRSEVVDLNIQQDLGIVYYPVVNGVIEGMGVDEMYAVVLDPSDRTHRFVFKKGGACMAAGVKANFVYTAEALRIFNMFAIASRARKLLATEWTMRIPAILHDGVPGCGKTHTILKMFNIRDVIVTMVRETKESTLVELKNDSRFEGYADVLEGRCRTSDSGLKHGLPQANRVIMDEGLMAHEGAMVAAVRLTRAKELHVFGDSTQISFINRGSKININHFESKFYWTQMLEYNETFRCPADAIWVSSQFYPESRRAKIKTFSPIMRSITFTHVPNAKDKTWSSFKDPAIVVSILRGDMETLISQNHDKYVKGNKADKGDERTKVYSVHEVQGRTKPIVIAVRITPYNAEVVNSPPHLNVMFTRHTLKWQGFGSRDDSKDLMSVYARAAERLTDEQLRAMMLPCPKWLQDKITKSQEKYAAHLY